MNNNDVSAEEIATWVESQETEIKAGLAQLEAGLKSLCALLNADSSQARVVFGIKPDGQVVGVEPGNLDAAQQKIASKIRNKFEPTPHVSIIVYQYQRRSLVVLKAERPQNVAFYEYDGRVYIREGTANRVLAQSDRIQLSRRRNRDEHNGPWRCDSCGAIVVVLSSLVISNRGVSKSYVCSCGGEYWPI